MRKAAELILVVVIAGTALAFGGVQVVVYSAAEVLLFLALLLVVLKQSQEGKVTLWVPFWPALFGLLAVLQMTPLPSWVVASLSPARLLGPDLAGLPPGSWKWTTLSIYPHATLLLLTKFLAYFSAFVLAAYFFDYSKASSLLIRALISLGSFEAAYGILQYLTGWQKIFTYTKVYNVSVATGTYINPNHFAGVLELTLPFVAASAFYFFQLWIEQRRTGARPHGSALRRSFGSLSILYLFLLVMMALSVAFSHSRMGILSALFSIVFVALLAQIKARRKVWALGVLLFFACVLGYGLWIGLNPVLVRFEQLREPEFLRMEGRFSIWKDGLELIREYPLTGTGLGTFGMAFRRYQTTAVDKYVDHAHNDYLEIASETGLVGLALLFVPVLFLLGRMIISFLDDHRRYRRAITLGCIGSTLAVLIHSITDFNLQIPANALIFSVVLGIGYKAAWIEREKDKQAPPPPRRLE